MRKFAIPKSIYVLLIFVLCILSIGYTYAYFSSTHQASANLELGKVGMVWRDYAVDQIINNGANSISITSEELDAGKFSKIQALTADQSSTRDSVLALMNSDATVSIYCRIKIEASYIPKGDTVSIDCEDQWIQLAYDNGDGNPKLITNNGWFYYNGYYYWGDSETKALQSINAQNGIIVANRIYLSTDVGADIYGGAVSITLTGEAVQTTNNAYKSVWEVNW